MRRFELRPVCTSIDNVRAGFRFWYPIGAGFRILQAVDTGCLRAAGCIHEYAKQNVCSSFTTYEKYLFLISPTHGTLVPSGGIQHATATGGTT